MADIKEFTKNLAKELNNAYMTCNDLSTISNLWTFNLDKSKFPSIFQLREGKVRLELEQDIDNAKGKIEYEKEAIETAKIRIADLQIRLDALLEKQQKQL